MSGARDASLHALSWPVERLGEALSVLAHESRIVGGSARRDASVAAARVPAGVLDDPRRLDMYVAALARESGIEAEERRFSHGEIERQLRLGGPLLLRLPGSARFLALLPGGGARLRLLAPDLATSRVPLESLRAALCAPHEARVAAEVDAVLRDAGTPSRRVGTARRALLGQMLSGEWIAGAWLLAPSPGAEPSILTREAAILPRALVFLGAHAAQLALWILSWALLGRAALTGRLDVGWLLAWGLVLLTIAPLRFLATWTGGSLAIAGGGLLRQRLLYGALRLKPEEIRSEGAGSLLGRVLESDALEQLALSGSYLAIVSVLELALAVPVLVMGAGGLIHVGLLALWLGAAAAAASAHLRQRRSWTEGRLELARDLVERMVGHRTRLAQQRPADWHEGEDRALERLLADARRMDRADTLLSALPSAWLVAGVAGLVPAFAWGAASPASLAIGLGGVLLAHQALSRLAPGLANLAGARVAWQQVALLAAAAEREEKGADAAHVLPDATPASPRGPLLEAREISFNWPGRSEPVLKGVNLSIARGDKLLLEGPSGGGKSTLASVLAGLRAPGSGLLLLDGVDRPTLGAEGWRRRVASAPQFHENHVLTGPFAFNALMGRPWWIGDEDVGEADAICRDLGLGPLLDRMPGGLMQAVGETGWQLSHGEKSRLYLARGLLQGGELIILDESFAALDPETMRLCLECTLARARTLLVIAHP